MIKNIKKVESCGTHRVYSTNVDVNHNYISENGIIHKNCVIDQDYQGEVFIDLHNIGTDNWTLMPGNKIAQMVLHKLNRVELSEINIDDLYVVKTERGEGALGSSN